MTIHLYRPGSDEEDEVFLRLLTQPIFGAEDDGDEDEEGDDEEEDDEEEDDDPESIVKKLTKDAEDAKKKAKANSKKETKATSGPKYVPPSESEYKKMVSALARANHDQRARRQAALEKARAEGLSEGEATARADAEEKAKNRYEPLIIEYEANIALREAKCKNPARLVKLIDKSAVTIVENPKNGRYEAIGIEEQVNALMDDWPELFGNDSDDEDEKPVTKPRGKHLDASDRRPSGGRRARSSTEEALERLRGLV